MLSTSSPQDANTNGFILNFVKYVIKNAVDKVIQQKAKDIVHNALNEAANQYSSTCYSEEDLSCANIGLSLRCEGKDAEGIQLASNKDTRSVHFASPVAVCEEYSQQGSGSTIELDNLESCYLKCESLYDSPDRYNCHYDFLQDHTVLPEVNNNFTKTKRFSISDNLCMKERFILKTGPEKYDDGAESWKICEEAGDKPDLFQLQDLGSCSALLTRAGDPDIGIFEDSPSSGEGDSPNQNDVEKVTRRRCAVSAHDFDLIKLDEPTNSDTGCITVGFELQKDQEGQNDEACNEAELIVNNIVDEVCLKLEVIRMDKLSQLSSEGSEVLKAQNEGFGQIPLTQLQESQESFINFVPTSDTLSQEKPTSIALEQEIESTVHVFVDERRIGEKNKVHIISDIDFEQVPSKESFQMDAVDIGRYHGKRKKKKVPTATLR